jgi:MFS transporter, ACS family, hexuronate transporter
VSGGGKIRNLRWLVAGLLFAATVINYVDRQVLSVTAPVLREQFGMTNTDYSRVIFAFLLAYTVMQGASGRLIDRLGTRAGFALCIAWWSAAGMLHAAARSAWQLGLFRFLLGAGEAGNWPAAVKAVAEWFPPRERAFAVGLFNSGSAVGAVVAPPLVTWLTLKFSWQAAFLLTGLLGFVWLAAWLLVYRAPERHPRITERELKLIEAGRQEREAESSAALRWLDLLKYRQVWGLMLARMLADPVWWFYVFWLPEYLKTGRGFTLAMIGYFAWIPFLAADVGNFVGGGLSGWLVRRGVAVTAARKAVMAGSAAVMTLGVFAVSTPSAAASIALISLVTLAYSSWAANILSLPADIFPARVVASVVGLSGAAAGAGGMLFTLLTGWMLDRFSYTPVFAAAAVMPVAAALLIARLISPLERSGGDGGEDIQTKSLGRPASFKHK